MKQISMVLNITLAIALIFILAAIGLPSLNVRAAPPAEDTEVSEQVCNTGRSIQVSGTAVVNVTPDRVLIQLGVQSNATTPQKVENANSATINQVIQALESTGDRRKGYCHRLVRDRTDL